jgi:hypothetical protein
MLTHFKGPGTLTGLSQVNTDKVTLAFAQGPNVGKRMIVSSAHPFDARANAFLPQQLINSISSQLINLQTTPN